MRRSRAEWAQHISAWRRGGGSVKQYCDEHDIRVGTFRYWMARVPDADESSNEGKASGAVADERAAVGQALSFAKVRRRVSKAPKSSLPGPRTKRAPPLRVVVDTVVVEVPAGFDPEALRQLLKVLAPLGGGQ